jgi:ubiquinone/menaquinone biosynthesis C-methylase UbiE
MGNSAAKQKGITNSYGTQFATDMNEEQVQESVQQYYGKTLETSKDLKTNACTTSGSPHPIIQDCLRKIPTEILEKFYGCGNPIPLGIEGLSVLDLGSGSGRDCYIASQMVGPKGKVIGVDMTDEQLVVARKYTDSFCQKMGFSAPNMDFVQGYIEQLAKAGIAKNSVDLVISNCVINLSPRKDLVLKECFDSLKPGGEMYFSDVYCDRRLPQHIREHEVLWGECLAGALYIEDFKRLCREVGFLDPRALSTSLITVNDPELEKILGKATFYSILYRLFKTEGLETTNEDYGQTAIYKGTIHGNKHGYQLDDKNYFETKKPALISGNTASILEESWLAQHFEVVGDRSRHFGLFNSGPSIPMPVAVDAPAPQDDVGCCGPSDPNASALDKALAGG